MYFLNGNFILLLYLNLLTNIVLYKMHLVFPLITDSEIAFFGLWFFFFFFGLHWVFAVAHGRGFSISSLVHRLSCPMACEILVP